MHFTKIFNLAALVTAASATTVSYDPGYDDGSRSMTVVSCSDGPNGLITRYGWNTQGVIPRFPYVGGVEAIGSWGSPNCGTCWQVSWNGRSVYILGIDHAGAGVNMAKAAMNDLTNGQADFLGRIEADVTQVATANCGI